MTKNGAVITLTLSIFFLTYILYRVFNGHDNFINGIGFTIWCYNFYNSITFLVDYYDAK